MKVEWSVRRSKLGEEDNCCGVIEQHAADQEDDQEGQQHPAGQVDGELLADQVHADLAGKSGCQHGGIGGAAVGLEEGEGGLNEHGSMKIVGC